MLRVLWVWIGVRIGVRIRGRRVANDEVYGIGKRMGLVGVVGVGNAKSKRVETGLAVLRYAQWNRAKRSPVIVRSWSTAQSLAFAAVCIRAASPVQHVKAVTDGGEFVIVITAVVAVLINAGEVLKNKAGIQILSRRKSIFD